MTIRKFIILGAVLVGSGCSNDCTTLAVVAPQVNVLDSSSHPLLIDALTWSQGAETGTANCQGSPGPCSVWILDRAPAGPFQLHAILGTKTGDAPAEIAWMGGCPRTPVPVNVKITLI